MVSNKSTRTLLESVRQSASAMANNTANLAVATCAITAQILDSLESNADGVALVIDKGLSVSLKAALTVEANLAALVDAKENETFQEHYQRSLTNAFQRWSSSSDKKEEKKIEETIDLSKFGSF